MKVVVRRSELRGEVEAPPSKAYTDRALVAALLSDGTSEIVNPLVSDDTQATLGAIREFGARVKIEENRYLVEGAKPLRKPEKPIDCGDSGATLRFMVPVATLAPGSSTFKPGKSLMRRPIEPLLQSLRHLGADCSIHLTNGELEVRVQGGGLKGGRTQIRGDISSQFISGLLFASPMAEEETEIIVTTPLESRGYVQMTLETLASHRIEVSASEDLRRFEIAPKQSYKPHDHKIPGDYSSAAFLLAAAAITSSRVRVLNLSRETTQGDKAILDILMDIGAEVRVSDNCVEVEARELNAVDIDVRDVPDLVPVCAALACYARGTSRLYNARRLRYKESDRLFSLHSELKKMGADITIADESLVIKGPCTLHGAVINPHGDHRIAMACTIAALGARGETTIQEAECVRKSYPNFFTDLKSLGACIIGW